MNFIKGIKHIIFDFGGVLSEKTYVLKKLSDLIKDIHDIKYVGRIFTNEDTDSLRTSKINEREILIRVLIRHKIYYNKLLIDFYIKVWKDLCYNLVNIIPEMGALVRSLKQRGYTVSVLSNTYGLKANINRKKGYYDLFQPDKNYNQVFLSYEIGAKKPYSRIYKYVLSQVEENPEEILFIDNKIDNLIPAINLGFNVLQLDNNKFNEKKFKIFLKKLEKYIGKLNILLPYQSYGF